MGPVEQREGEEEAEEEGYKVVQVREWGNEGRELNVRWDPRGSVANHFFFSTLFLPSSSSPLCGHHSYSLSIPFFPHYPFTHTYIKIML